MVIKGGAYKTNLNIWGLHVFLLYFITHSFTADVGRNRDRQIYWIHLECYPQQKGGRK